MKASTIFVLAQSVALFLCTSIASAQTSDSQVNELGPADAAAAEPADGQSEAYQPAQTQQVFSQQELDQMLAPIALYPDSLLSQILMASTYPIEVVQAARWSKANPGVSGDQAVQAVEQNNWDASVKSLVAFPQVIAMMDEKLDWMERLGDAFLSQQQQVMNTVQELRQKAQAAGNLQSNQNVRVEEPQGQTIVIEQANPQVVYVPYYNPTVVYGPWWYPEYPPVYWGPWPGYYARPGFGTGFFWGSGITISTGFFFGGFDWPHRHVNVVNVHNYYYRPSPRYANLPAGGWYHDPGHRRGVPYRDPVLRQEFGHYAGRPDTRRDFRGNEPQRVQGPTAVPRALPDSRNAPGNRAERDRVQPRNDHNVRPNAPDATGSQPRSVPRANVGTPPSRPTVPNGAGAQWRRPTLPAASVAPSAPAAQSRPHIFDGVGQGAVVRDSSQRGNSSAQHAAAPVRPAAQAQGAAPAARQAGSASAQRHSEGAARSNEGQPQRQQR
jgi:hypothetical protein